MCSFLNIGVYTLFYLFILCDSSVRRHGTEITSTFHNGTQFSRGNHQVSYVRYFNRENLHRRTQHQNNSGFLKIAKILKKNVFNIEEDADLSIIELILKYGYPIEEHNIKTKDGYILTLHRIPFGKKQSVSGKPVLVLHSLLGSSDDWIVMGPGKGLGYVLADAGYDVWLANVRGNKHSKNHVYLSNSERLFWKFTLHEMAIFDLTAMIDYVLEVTKERQLHYIGHSQGAVLFFILCSFRPEFNDKIKLSFLLAPVAWAPHMTSALMIFMMQISGFLDMISNFAPNSGFLQSSDLTTFLSQVACNNAVPTQFLCSNIIFLCAGVDEDQMNTTMLPVILSHAPSGCSTRQLAHYGQNYQRNAFGGYDYGVLQNIAKYGSPTPPRYPLENISAPIAMAYGLNDAIASPKDVKILRDILVNVVDFYEVPFSKFNHLDFLWGNDAKTLVYDRVLETMAKY